MASFKYETYSRAFPIYITIMPFVLILLVILPEGYDWKLGGASAIVLLPLSYMCKQIGGDAGKRKENNLWRNWEGPPTTRFLRHDNPEFNPITRKRIHDMYRGKGFCVPTLEEQQQNPEKADMLYESCVDELRRRTRDKDQFPRVFQELRDYGFRRNLYGLKPYGLTFSILSFLLCLIYLIVGWNTGNQDGTAIIPCLFNLGLIVVWLTTITEKTVRLTADRYARFILEASLELESINVNDTLP